MTVNACKPVGSERVLKYGKRAVALILASLGLLLGAGGLQLFALSGSAYYAVAGGVLLVTAVLLWRTRRLGEWAFGLFILGTLGWSLNEAGLDLWGLLSRLGLFLGLALCLCLIDLAAYVRRAECQKGPDAGALILVIAVMSSCVAMILGSMGADGPQAVERAQGFVGGRPVASDWESYGKGLDGVRYVEAGQINPANVGKLKIAWSYRSGDIPQSPYSFQATPLKISETLYICTPHRWIIALDAQSGREKWRFIPSQARNPEPQGLVCRGVSYHAGSSPGLSCNQRILSVATDNHLFAVDALTGKPCQDFGANGSVSLLDGLGKVAEGETYVTAPGLVVGDRIILGSYVADGKSIDMPSGVVRAFDVRTGQLLWAWDMGAPDRVGAPRNGQTYTRSTPNAWAAFSADEKLNLVYVPTGNPSPDFFGSYRRPFDEAFGTAIVALDLNTGQPRWHFQAVHHDLWDLDIPAQPILTEIPTHQGNAPALIQLTKNGDILVLNRETGRPIVPVHERQVPQGGVPEERVSPTQPFSELTFAPPPIRENDMWGLTPIDQMLCRIQFARSRYEGRYTPPGLKQAVGYTSSQGIFSWGGGALDPKRGLLVVNTTYMPFLTRLVPTAAGGRPGAAPPKPDYRGEYAWLAQGGTPYGFMTEPFLSVLGVPCLQPPWGELAAVDLRTRRVIWRRPLGSGRDSGPFGISSHLPATLGVPNVGGALSTSGGVVFIGATVDRYLRAFDVRTGRELWRGRLPAGGQATPMSYVSSRDGRQYVVIAAGGHYGLKTKRGDYLVAFSLPNDRP